MDDIKLFASSCQHLHSLLTTLSLFSDDICMQFGCSKWVQQLLFHSMHLWNTILTVEGNIYGEVSIQCGIFQGDSLSPLLFTMALMPLSIILNNSGKGYLLQRQNPRVSHLMYMDDIKLFASSRQHLDSLLTTLSLFSDDICMQFGCSKCNILTLTRGCITTTDDFKLPSVSNGTIASLAPTSAYRYLGVLESAVFHHSDMKEKLFMPSIVVPFFSYNIQWVLLIGL